MRGKSFGAYKIHSKMSATYSLVNSAHPSMNYFWCHMKLESKAIHTYKPFPPKSYILIPQQFQKCIVFCLDTQYAHDVMINKVLWRKTQSIRTGASGEPLFFLKSALGSFTCVIHNKQDQQLYVPYKRTKQ